jgi:transcriptional regulator with XRE-family HTH domain
MPTLSEKIRAAALASGLKQAEIAKALGCSASMVSLFLNGDGRGKRRDLSMPSADKLAKLLGLELVQTKATKRAKKGA